MRADIEHIRFAELSRTTDRGCLDALIDLGIGRTSPRPRSL
jgi:hypothetical protein